MTQKFSKLGASLASSALLACGVAMADSHDMYLQDSSGAAVRDSSGDCVLVIDGLAIAECMAAAPEPEPAPAPTVTAISLSADAFFDFDHANLKPAGEAELGQLAGQLSGTNVRSVDIVGHTDSIGSEKYNQSLSEARANTVADYLVSQGVDAGVISTSGAGETQPVASNDTDDGRAQNRRVDVSVSAESSN